MSATPAQSPLGDVHTSDELAAADAEILRKRAERLARRENAAPATDELALLTFTVGPERFALPLNEVKGVVPLDRYTRIPGAPPELLGVVQIRGELAPLLDLASVFQLPADADGRRQAVLGAVGISPALRVDRVNEVIRVSRQALQAPEQAGSHSGLLAGVLPDRTAVIRMEALLTHPALCGGSR